MRKVTNKNNLKQGKRSVAIGNFDGVHLGHQEILKKEIDLVYTFYPHPSRILYPLIFIPQINSLEERLALIKKLGIHTIVVQKFTKSFSQKLAQQFFYEIIVKKLKTHALYVGHNFFFGKNRKGNILLLKKLCSKNNIKLHVVKPFKINNEVVSSSSIRKFIHEGNVKKSASFLGRFYSVQGIVVPGKKRGLGMPTANLKTDSELIPKAGVYATWTEFNNKRYPSITNIGTSPTFSDDSFSIETYIFNFNKNIYDEKIILYFVDRIRDTKKFASAEKLRLQIKKDILKTKKIL